MYYILYRGILLSLVITGQRYLGSSRYVISYTLNNDIILIYRERDMISDLVHILIFINPFKWVRTTHFGYKRRSSVFLTLLVFYTMQAKAYIYVIHEFNTFYTWLIFVLLFRHRLVETGVICSDMFRSSHNKWFEMNLYSTPMLYLSLISFVNG